MYKNVQQQYQQYLVHVVTNIFGIYETIKNVNQFGPIYQPISRETQQQALDFLNEQFFTTPKWLLDTTIMNRTGETPLGVIGMIQDKIFLQLFFPPNIQQMISRGEAMYGKKVMNFVEIMDQLDRYIWSELKTNKPIDIFRRSLQKMYVKNLFMVFARTSINTRVAINLPISGTTYMFGQDALAIVAGHLKELEAKIKKQLPAITDRETKYHLQYVIEKINQNFEFLRKSALY
jgi:hypothetical protein